MSENVNSVARYVDTLLERKPAAIAILLAKTEAEFEDAFDRILEFAVKHLESNKKNFSSLGEDGLTGVVAAALSIPDILVARQETNCNGHVDLTVEAFCLPQRTKLGEAKLYSGPSYHAKGITQLLRRYTTGRESPGLILNYVRRENIAGIVAKLRQMMDEDLPESQTGLCEAHSVLKWSLVTKHRHSSGECLSVTHIGFNLYIETPK